MNYLNNGRYSEVYMYCNCHSQTAARNVDGIDGTHCVRHDAALAIPLASDPHRPFVSTHPETFVAMSNSATKRETTVTRLPPEVLLEILSHVPHERTKGLHQLGLSERQGVRPFKPQLAFAHVCRAWRNVLLGSKYWSGVRLSLKSAEHLEEGLAHDNGKALLYVHISQEHRYCDVMHNGRKVRAPLRALKHLSRIRTLFLETTPGEDGGTGYTLAIENQDAPELQDFTFRWLTAWGDRKRNELEFITNPFPRLRYLDSTLR